MQISHLAKLQHHVRLLEQELAANQQLHVAALGELQKTRFALAIVVDKVGPITLTLAETEAFRAQLAALELQQRVDPETQSITISVGPMPAKDGADDGSGEPATPDVPRIARPPLIIVPGAGDLAPH